MSPIEVPVYRPEVTVYRRDADGQWDTDGTITNTLFRPLPDEDGTTLTEAGFRKVVRLGAEPFFRILAPPGSTLVEKGRAQFLRLPNGKSYDPTTALAYAKSRCMGLDLVRPGREPARAVFIEPAPAPPPPPPPPARPRGPARQLSMFDMEGATP